MIFIGKAAPLTLDGLEDAAYTLGVENAVILAIIDVETKGCGFLRDMRPQMLFERHVFHKWTNGYWDHSHPDISAASPGRYGIAVSQYDRLAMAMSLHEEFALYSASWGLGQIMGFNYRPAGYGSVKQMVAAFCDGEDEQVMAIAAFCKHRRLDDDLRRHSWATFAFGYNGPAFASHAYDKRLEAAYDHLKNAPIDLSVRAKQVSLYFAGLLGIYDIDGIIGPRTLAAIKMQEEFA